MSTAAFDDLVASLDAPMAIVTTARGDERAGCLVTEPIGSHGSPPPPKADPWPEDRVPSPFEHDVIEAIGSLVPGDVATYGEIAEEVGRPGAAQAVGNVVRHARSLPWWRIVPADGRIYCTHAPVQVPLLEAEGHHIIDRRLV